MITQTEDPIRDVADLTAPVPLRSRTRLGRGSPTIARRSFGRTKGHQAFAAMAAAKAPRTDPATASAETGMNSATVAQVRPRSPVCGS